MGDDDLKRELDKIRERIHYKKKLGPDKLVNLFKEREEGKIRWDRIKKLTSAVRELEEDKRILGAVSAHFDQIPKSRFAEVEVAYPKLVQRLYHISERLVDGYYGKTLKSYAESGNEKLMNWKVIFFLAVIDLTVAESKDWAEKNYPVLFDTVKKTKLFQEVSSSLKKVKVEEVEKIVFPPKGRTSVGVKKCRELLEKLFAAISMPKRDAEVVIRIFRSYLSTFSSPSHVSVDLMLDRGRTIDKPIRAAGRIKKLSERSKSMVHIVNKLFSDERVDSAIKVVRQIKAKKELAKPLKSLVNRLFGKRRLVSSASYNDEQVDEAVALAQTVTDPEEKNSILQRVSYGLAQSGEVKRGKEIALTIDDLEARNYALSSIVSALAAQEKFDDAVAILEKIKDPIFREDAISYIVKGYLDHAMIDKVIRFVQGIESQVEKTRAAKIILSSVTAHHNKKRIEEVCEKFELIK